MNYEALPTRPGRQPGARGINPRIIIALVLAAIALITYFSNTQFNPITGEHQRLSLSPQQEVGLGLQALPQMVAQHGGAEERSRDAQLVKQVGNKLVRSLYDKLASEGKTDVPQWPFEFHLLSDPKTINAFALPGGQVFITRALYDKLQTEGQLAGVLGHEIGHVVGRHGAEHLATAQLIQGLSGAAVLATYDPQNPASQNSAAVVAAVGQLVNLKYGRDDELESDRLGIDYMVQAGYDPRSMVGVMQILKEASGGASPPEFLSTHPDPGNRIEKIGLLIREKFPQGVPSGLVP
jgi:predicted Zn-dependent protease